LPVDITGDEGREAEDALVVAARRGDRPALEQLLLRHYDRIFALCRRMLCHDSDAEDATQETLVAAVRSLSRFDGRSSFSTWIYRIATNACIDELRRRKRRPVVAFAETADGLLDRATVVAGSHSPADAVATRVDVDRALATLGPEFRAAVVLRDLCDLSYEEIARVLDVPIGTVRSRIARARGLVADMLGNFDGPPGVQGSRKTEASNAIMTTEMPGQ
jgi:RNA polymerase sigma-70 factor, ECF subfamily